MSNQFETSSTNCAHFNKGTLHKVAFVFSCPGKQESACQHPVSGKTGANLTLLLQILRDNYNNSIFSSPDKYNYRITNASSEVHYKAYDGKTEPTFSEIMEHTNLLRISDELGGFKLVIAFGSKAIYAVNYAIPRGNIVLIECMHLSFPSINRQIQNDIYGHHIVRANTKEQKKANTVKRLTVLADMINRLLPE